MTDQLPPVEQQPAPPKPRKKRTATATPKPRTPRNRTPRSYLVEIRIALSPTPQGGPPEPPDYAWKPVATSAMDNLAIRDTASAKKWICDNGIDGERYRTVIVTSEGTVTEKQTTKRLFA